MTEIRNRKEQRKTCTDDILMNYSVILILLTLAVKSVQEKKQMFNEVVLAVQPYVTVPMVDEEVPASK